MLLCKVLALNFSTSITYRTRINTLFFPTLTSYKTMKLRKCLDWLLSSLMEPISLGSTTSERMMPLNTNFINPLNKV